MFMTLLLLSTGSLFHEKLLDLMPGLTEKKQAILIIWAAFGHFLSGRIDQAYA